MVNFIVIYCRSLFEYFFLVLYILTVIHSKSFDAAHYLSEENKKNMLNTKNAVSAENADV